MLPEYVIRWDDSERTERISSYYRKYRASCREEDCLSIRFFFFEKERERKDRGLRRIAKKGKKGEGRGKRPDRCRKSSRDLPLPSTCP